MALKTIYFDLGNVLCFFSRAKMIGQLAACSGIEPQIIKKLLIEKKLQSRYEKGQINTKELHALFLSLAPRPLSYELFMRAITDIFHPNKELWSVVEQLKDQGIRLILLSNTCESHYQWIDSNYPILKLFDKQILSFEIGLVKPDPLIFQKALTFANCEPQECFYIDDIKEYVDSARAEGLNSEVFTDVASLKLQLKNKFSINLK